MVFQFFFTINLTYKNRFVTSFSPFIQNIICRSGLGHYQLIAFARPHGSSVRLPTINCLFVLGTSSVVGSSVRPPNFAGSHSRQPGKLRAAQHVLPDTGCSKRHNCAMSYALSQLKWVLLTGRHMFLHVVWKKKKNIARVRNWGLVPRWRGYTPLYAEFATCTSCICD